MNYLIVKNEFIGKIGKIIKSKDITNICAINLDGICQYIGAECLGQYRGSCLSGMGLEPLYIEII